MQVNLTDLEWYIQMETMLERQHVVKSIQQKIQTGWRNRGQQITDRSNDVAILHQVNEAAHEIRRIIQQVVF